MSKQSVLTNDQIYTLLEMRCNGNTYRDIAKELGINREQVSRKYTSLLANYNNGYMERVKAVSQISGKSFSEIVSMLKCKINFYNDNKKKPKLRIRINKDNLPKNIWYSNKGGSIFEASTNGTYYTIENKALFKVYHQHCTVYNPHEK